MWLSACGSSGGSATEVGDAQPDTVAPGLDASNDATTEASPGADASLDAGAPKDASPPRDAGAGADASTDAPTAPACSGGQTCVPTAPSGWTGPVLYYSGSGDAGALPSCPTGSSAAFTGGTGIVSPAAACSACTCGGVGCSDPIVHFYSSCNSSGSGTELGSVTATSNCKSSGIACGGYFDIGTETTALCTPSAQSPMVPANQWATASEACATTDASAACGTGDICAPSATGFSPCVYQAGDVACPAAGYTAKQLIDTVMADTRGCTPCTCGAPSTGDGGPATCSGGLVTVSDQSSCPGPGSGTDLYTQQFFVPVGCYMNGVPCDPGTTTYLNVYKAATATAGTCSPDGGVVTGSVTTSQVTVCCM